MIWLVLCAACVGILAILQTGLLILGWLFLRDRNDEATADADPATVIVALHNEAPTSLHAENLKMRMTKILDQDYPCDVIFVNDRSTDHTAEVLTELASAHAHVQVIDVMSTPENTSPKKWALRQGIEAAQTDILVFTDADCTVHPFWLEHITRPMRNGKDIALGYSPPRAKLNLLNLIQRYEAFSTAYLYLGMARIGLAYMGVGRNIGYRKSLLTEPAFESHLSVLSGDDDLFINQYAKERNVGIVLHPTSHVLTKPTKGWIKWTRQKTRHISSSKHYRLRNKILLGLFGFTLTGAYLFAIPTAIFWKAEIGIYLIVLTAVLRAVTMIPAALRLKAGQLLPFLVILEFMQLLYNVIIVPLGWMLKPVWQKKTTNPPNAQ